MPPWVGCCCHCPTHVSSLKILLCAELAEAAADIVARPKQVRCIGGAICIRADRDSGETNIAIVDHISYASQRLLCDTEHKQQVLALVGKPFAGLGKSQPLQQAIPHQCCTYTVHHRQPN